MSGLLLLLLGLVTLLFGLFRRRSRRAGEPPLIEGWIPFVGKALEYGVDSLKFLEKQQKIHGDVFTVHLLGQHLTFVMNPVLYPYVTKHGPVLEFHKIADQMSSRAFDFPRLVNNPHPGLKDQLLHGHKFLRQDVEAMLASFRDYTMLLLREDHQGRPTGPGGWWRSTVGGFTEIMFDAVVLTIFGRPPAENYRSELRTLSKDIHQFDDMFPFLTMGLPAWVLGKTYFVRKSLHKYFLPQTMKLWSKTSLYVQERSKIFDQYSDMKDHHKAAHHVAILWASTINLIPSAFWALNGTLTTPEAVRRTREELQDLLGLGDMELGQDLTLTREDLDKPVYLESVLDEGLRFASASIPPREVLEDTTLDLGSSGTVSLRKGDIVALYPHSMHMDPDIYQDPQKYQFDRFVQDGKKKTDFYKNGEKLTYFLMPFGYGVSRCPGQSFARHIIKYFICAVLLYFEVQVDEGQSPPVCDPSRGGLGTLPPIGDTRFRYRLRIQEGR